MLIDTAFDLLTPLTRNHCAYPIGIFNGTERLFPALVPSLVDFLNISW